MDLIKRESKVIIVGDGNFSFAKSFYLKTKHKKLEVTATGFDNQDDFVKKYGEKALNDLQMFNGKPSSIFCTVVFYCVQPRQNYVSNFRF